MIKTYKQSVYETFRHTNTNQDVFNIMWKHGGLGRASGVAFEKMKKDNNKKKDNLFEEKYILLKQHWNVSF